MPISREGELFANETERRQVGERPEPACPACLRGYAENPPAEDHTPALLAALRDILDASTDLGAEELIPRKLRSALNRADNVLADVLNLPF